MFNNFFKYLSVNMINILLSYALLIYFSRELSKVDYAEFGLYTSIAGLFFILVNLGHREALFKYASQSKFRLLFNTINSAIFISLFWFVLVVAVSWWYSELLLFSLLSTIVGHAIASLAMVYRGKGHYFTDAIIIPAHRFLWLLFAGVSVLAFDELSVGNVFLSAVLAGVIVMLVFSRKAFYKRVQKCKPSKFFISNKTILSFLAIEVITIVYIRLDMIILHALSEDASGLADYFFSIQIYDAILMLLAPVSFIFFNAINSNSEPNAVRNSFVKSIAILSLVVVAGYVTWWLAGSFILQWMFANFTTSFDIIRYFIIASFFAGLNMIGSRALFARSREGHFIAIHAVILCIYVCCVPIYFEHFAFNGVVINRIVSEVLMCFLIFGILFRYKNEYFVNKKAI